MSAKIISFQNEMKKYKEKVSTDIVPLFVESFNAEDLEKFRMSAMYNFSEKMYMSMNRAAETKGFTQNLDMFDTQDVAEFYKDSTEFYNSHVNEIQALDDEKTIFEKYVNRKGECKNKRAVNFNEMANRYYRFLSDDQDPLASLYFVYFKELDKCMDVYLKNKLNRLNEIVHVIKDDKFSDDWYQLYDFYKEMGYKGPAIECLKLMARKGDGLAEQILGNPDKDFIYADPFEIVKNAFYINEFDMMKQKQMQDQKQSAQIIEFKPKEMEK